MVGKRYMEPFCMLEGEEVGIGEGSWRKAIQNGDKADEV